MTLDRLDQILSTTYPESERKEYLELLPSLIAQAKEEGVGGDFSIYEGILEPELLQVLAFTSGTSYILKEAGLDPKLASVLERFSEAGAYLLKYCRDKIDSQN